MINIHSHCDGYVELKASRLDLKHKFGYNSNFVFVLNHIHTSYLTRSSFKGCDSLFKVNIFKNLKVATNETSSLHQTICTWMALEIYNNNNQQFNRHDFLIKFSLSVDILTL